MGPLISAAHRETVASFVEGEPLFRGDAPDGKGFWFPCTLVEARPDDRIAREEVFGPVAALIPFDDEADAIRIANDSPYGLSGSIWTRDGARALRVARAIETGVLSVNSNSSVRASTPFGGFKQSGFGRELGMHALDGYSEVKNVFYLDGGVMRTARRQGLRDHRRRRRHGPRGGAALHRGGREGLRRRRRPRARRGDGRRAAAGDALARAGATSPTRTRSRRCTRRPPSASAASTSSTTTPASRPPTTTRSSTPTVEAWQRVQDVNTKGVFLCCKHGIPYLLERGGGSVINVASFVAIVGAATSQISYTASKGAVLVDEPRAGGAVRARRESA